LKDPHLTVGVFRIFNIGGSVVTIHADARRRVLMAVIGASATPVFPGVLRDGDVVLAVANWGARRHGFVRSFADLRSHKSTVTRTFNGLTWS